jgi:hypothetical protein
MSHFPHSFQAANTIADKKAGAQSTRFNFIMPSKT